MVPGSVQSLVQARMDQLEPADRQALQTASVLGQRFALDALRHLLDSPNYTCTGSDRAPAGAAGGRRAAVRPRPDPRRRLRHPAQGRRRQLHRKAAGWFGDGEPVLRAEHLDRAGDPAAPSAYLAAARSETAAYRYQRARDLVERGLEIATAPADIFALTCQKGRAAARPGRDAGRARFLPSWRSRWRRMTLNAAAPGWAWPGSNGSPTTSMAPSPTSSGPRRRRGRTV